MAASAVGTVAAAPVRLFTPKTAYEYGQGPEVGASSNGTGHKPFAAASPPYGAEIVYHVAAGAAPAPAVAADAAAGAHNGVTPDTTAANGVATGDNAAAGTGNRRRGGPGAPRGPQASILITNARGDTVRTLTGPATPGLHRVVWDFRGRPAPRAPLSPSQRRDSVEHAQRITVVVDSLDKAGAPRVVTETLRRLASGSIEPASLFRGGGRGSAGTGGAWVARPGEGAFVGGGRAREQTEGAAGAGGEQSPGEALEAFPGGTDALGDLLQIPGRPPERGGLGALFGGGGGRGRGGPPVVASGDYLVTLTVGGRSYKQLLRVERLSGGDESGSAFEEDGDDGRDP
jgi:hypothetical protein